MEELTATNDLSNKGNKQTNKTGLLLVGFTGAVAVGLSVISAPFVLPAFRKFCLPYIPATNEQVRNVLTALKNNSQKGSRLADLGSGDGRIVIAAARDGFKSHGIELNSFLVLYSKISARLAGVSSHATFRRQDLWKANLHSYDNVVIFGVTQMMETLGGKMEKELKDGCLVAACRFPVPDWTPTRTIGEGIDTVWLYQMPQSLTPELNKDESVS
ncbi:ATP synthase subunit C lysine N-methyltransferase-like [Apostichopus japonicus]|uniref:ATP synthase subunit C lysine N-methyltransferase-like n=1 Tax=Stichopus japonicus TaxID=307972 RepID=UPI003AB46ADA